MKHPNFEPETYFHIYNHAVGNENLFRNEGNYEYFLQKIGLYTEGICRVYAYCLMPNHFHFLVRFEEEEKIREKFLALKRKKDFDFHDFVMQQFQNMMNGYAQAYNKMFQRKGALFVDYLKRKPVRDETYFSKLVHYIHYNPIHHGFCKNIDDWRFSSFHAFLSRKTTKLEREAVLEWFGNEQMFREFHQQKPDDNLFLEFD